MTNQKDNLTSKTTSPAKLVYLFTSTRQPYIKDALDLLALPLGMTYRFRYDIKYLPNEFFENSGNGKKLVSLKGKDALLVHTHTTPDKVPKLLEALPIRKAKILEAKLMGDFVWIQFVLGNWIKYDEAKESSKNIYHQKIIDILPENSENEFKITATIASKKEFDEINESPLSQEAIISNWSNLVSFVKGFSGHEHSVFLKLLGIIDLNNSDKLSPEDLGNSKSGFAINSGRTYQIEILQRYYSKINEIPFNLEVKTNSEDVIQIKALDHVQGKYDILRFTFSTESLAKSRYSFITIQPEEKISTEFMISRPFYDLKIKPHVKNIAGYLTLIAAGITLTSSGTWVLSEDVSFLNTILPIVGGVATAIGAFLIPKK